MKKLGIGILGPSDIAFRKFLPAIKSSRNFEYIGVAIATLDERSLLCNKQKFSVLEKSQEKANIFMNKYGGEIYYSYEELLASNDVNAVYIPLPPALHYFWAKKALDNGKHVLIEKPFTTNLTDTIELINIARKKLLALHENYAFCYHQQIYEIMQLIYVGEIGEIRQIRSSFGFPYRGASDFRYNKSLGGGALFDCGGYPIKLSIKLLGETTKVTAASLSMARNHKVDIYGTVTLENEEHITSQVSFGMDNAYKCEVEVWGSKGYIYAPRIFTAPSDYSPQIVVSKEKDIIVQVPMDDQFLTSINYFYHSIINSEVRNKTYNEIKLQGKIIDEVIKINSALRGGQINDSKIDTSS